MPSDERYQVSYYSLRIFVGVLGFLMPILVRVGAWRFEGVHELSVISAYYYTGMREVFVMSLVLAGALLATFRTPSALDTVLGTLAGIAAIGIALFPMDPVFGEVITRAIPDLQNGRCLVERTCYIPRGFLGFHIYFVAAFFILAFIIIVFRFTAFTPREASEQKLRRNIAYRMCGGLMAVSALLMAYFSWRKVGAGIFWSESAAVMSFAVAWLIKGQLFFADKRARQKKRISIRKTLNGEGTAEDDASNAVPPVDSRLPVA